MKQWLRERTDGASGFYSAQEDPGVAAKKSGAPPKKATAAKRVSNAALLDQMNVMMAQLQSLSVRQDALEKKTEVAPYLQALPSLHPVAMSTGCRTYQKASLPWVALLWTCQRLCS